MCSNRRNVLVALVVALLLVLSLSGCNMLFGSDDDDAPAVAKERTLNDLLLAIPDMSPTLWESAGAGSLQAAVEYDPAEDAAATAQAYYALKGHTAEMVPAGLTLLLFARDQMGLDETEWPLGESARLGKYGTPDGVKEGPEIDYGRLVGHMIPSEESGSELYEVYWTLSITFDDGRTPATYLNLVKLLLRFNDDRLVGMRTMVFDAMPGDENSFGLNAYTEFEFGQNGEFSLIERSPNNEWNEEENLVYVENMGPDNYRGIESREANGEYSLRAYWTNQSYGGTLDFKYGDVTVADASTWMELCHNSGELIERAHTKYSVSVENALPFSSDPFEKPYLSMPDVVTKNDWILHQENATQEERTWEDEDGTTQSYTWTSYDWYVKKSGETDVLVSAEPGSGAMIMPQEYRTYHDDWGENETTVYRLDLSHTEASQYFERSSAAADARSSFMDLLGSTWIDESYAKMRGLEIPADLPTLGDFPTLD